MSKRKAIDIEDKQDLIPPRTKIDPNGDLVLVIEEKELLVSRKVLCLSSSVFNAMLGDGSPYLESSSRVVASDGLGYVKLKEDNHEAMEIVTNVAHLQHDLVPGRLSFGLLDRIDTLSDKYDLRRCLGLWPQKWSEANIATVEKPGFERWLFIALVFRDAAIFSQISKRLILQSTTSTDGTLSFAWTSEGVPAGILGERPSETLDLCVSTDLSIDLIKTSMTTVVVALMGLCREYQHKLSRDLDIPVCCLSVYKRQCDAMNLGCLLQAIPELWKPETEDSQYRGTVQNFLWRMQNIPSLGNAIVCHQVGISNHMTHASCGLSQIMRSRMDGIMSSLQGLSLPP